MLTWWLPGCKKMTFLRFSYLDPFICWTQSAREGSFVTDLLCVSYCMVCVYVQEDNPRVLASGLFPVLPYICTAIQ